MLASVIVLTRNEARYITACLRSLLEQKTERADLEVLVVDSASTDGTVELVRSLALQEPRIHLIESERDISVGRARNIGVSNARGARIFFASADTEAEPGWLDHGLAALEDHDVVYGRQVHDAPDLTVAATLRGLRYHHYERARPLAPMAYASHVGAGYRRDVLTRFPFRTDPAGSALDDIILARQANESGLRISYQPLMVIRHHDADSLQGEWTKVRREAEGWGTLRSEVGFHVPLLAWGGVLAVGLLALLVRPSRFRLTALTAALWAPTARRAAARNGDYPMIRRGAAILIAPAFDLMALFHYVRRLLRPSTPEPSRPAPKPRRTEPSIKRDAL